MLDTVVMFVVVWCLVGVFVFSVMWSELLLVVLCGRQCTSAREWRCLEFGHCRA